ncbi:protein Aster-B-like [Apostichopus japonicus]|uniref:protein Aster-B-like n=1 Tax=Stichopus japonicus TaxID=307972 RepID=UPI003AB6BE7C
MSVKASNNRPFSNQRTLLDIASNVPKEQDSDKRSDIFSASGSGLDMAIEPKPNVDAAESLQNQSKGNDSKDVPHDTMNSDIDKLARDGGESTQDRPDVTAPVAATATTSDLEVPVTNSTSDPSSQSEKKVRISTPTKHDKSPSSSKKTKKSSPWYTVLTSSYKSKLDEFRKVFKTLPENERLVADYSCALQKDILVHGRMYVTENWICFYANIFRWETVLTVRIKDVAAITKERTIRFIPNAIQVSTATEKYFFASFMSRDKAFHLLFKVWQNALLAQSMTSLEYWSWIHKLYGSDLGLDEEELPHDYVEPVDEETATKEKEKEEGRGTPDVTSRVGEDLAERDDGTEEGEEISKSDGELHIGLEETSDLLSASDIDEGVDPITLLGFEGKSVLNEFYNIPVDQLFTSLIAGPETLYEKVLEANGSTDIVVSDWNSENEIEERTFCHNMQVHTGFATKTCSVVEKYSAPKSWLKPGKAYVLDTAVKNKGVPYSDYFIVRLGHVLTAVNSIKTHYRIIINVDYIKSPMGLMKGLIERGIESGIRQNKALTDKLIRSRLEKLYKRKKTRKKSSIEEPASEEPQQKQRSREPPKSTVISAMKWVLPQQVSTKLESKSLQCTTIILISFGLIVLVVFNMFLYFQLQYLHRSYSKTPSLSLDEVVQSIKGLPEDSREWLLLLHQQQQYHELEMEKWREIMSMCVNLMKQIELTFEELKTGIQTSTSIPNLSQIILDMQQDLATRGNSNTKEEL